MGKKTRKTRWRTLTIADNEHSDSEESNTTNAPRLPKGYQQKSYYNKFSYSSQSTPRRRYQHDSTKSTRSSSTASENKITFNEDEYTRITTPRQDVLFKKGYLNKPKNYQTQTSTGTSTTSTGNSTGNGTPDHQSTDLEYESQFVFPNSFVDHNGIYYVNSYESYPLMLYNPPTYYSEFSSCKSKRYSTGSLTESMSPNNEEATSQDLSGGEASNNVSDYSGHHQLYNMVYPGYYVNGVGPPHDAVNGQCPSDQTRRIKKRRRRKTSKSQTAQDSSEYTEDESDCCDETNIQLVTITTEANCHIKDDEKSKVDEAVKENGQVVEITNDSSLEIEQTNLNIENALEETTKDVKIEIINEKTDSPPLVAPERNEETTDSLKGESRSSEVHPPASSEPTESEESEEKSQNPSSVISVDPQKSELKPDAEEFIPRAYRNSEITLNPNLQYIKVPPNFVPIPLVSIGDFNGQNFNPAFIPPGIPINFLPTDPKIFPNFVGYVPNNSFIHKTDTESEEKPLTNAANVNNQSIEVDATCDNSNTATDEMNPQIEEPTEKTLVQNINNKTIDIATIVSKLEEAAKEQEDENVKKTSKECEETQNSPRRKFYENKHFRSNQKFKNNYRRNQYNNPQNSPQKNAICANENISIQNTDTRKETNVTVGTPNTETCSEQDPEIQVDTSKYSQLPNGMLAVQVQEIVQEGQKYLKGKNNWKSGQNGYPKWQHNGIAKDFRSRQNGRIFVEHDNMHLKPYHGGKNYSSMLKNKSQNYVNEYNQEKYSKDRPSYSPKKGVQTEPTPKQPNQWISVSSRKKRKNKNMEESDNSFDDHLVEEKEEQLQPDSFEQYDVNLLVDVMPTKAEELIKTEIIEETVTEDNNTSQEQTSTINDVENASTHPTKESANEAESVLIVETDTLEIDNGVPEDGISKDEEIGEEPPVDLLPKLNIQSPTQQEIKTKKKKSKKGTQKPLTKRVIITDVDISMACEEIKTPIRKVVTRLNDVKTPNEKVEENKDEQCPKTEEKAVEAEAVDLPKTSDEEEKKKGKKKKKKSSKTTVSTSSLSSSSATINNADESYDFLLDSALSDESVEKTNIEMSQELDKIIQKGMYNSLEEKIKSLNIDESDGFFKSIFSKISSRESSVEKTGFTKTPDLTKILQNSSTLFKPSSVSQENYSQNKDINKILPDLDSPDEDGIFLENPDLTEIPPDQTVTKDTENEETKIEHLNRDSETINEGFKYEIDVERKTLYPITQAVKEWMCKTRETTPDVEILKSPYAIYKEFCDSASETDTAVSDTKILSLSEELSGDEEVTIFIQEKDGNSRKETIEQPALMDYEENNLDVCKEMKENCSGQEYDVNNKLIEQGEDVVEVYESKYGKNEDYLNLQREVREKANNTNYPKHGNLPYRAICCSIM